MLYNLSQLFHPFKPYSTVSQVELGVSRSVQSTMATKSMVTKCSLKLILLIWTSTTRILSAHRPIEHYQPFSVSTASVVCVAQMDQHALLVVTSNMLIYQFPMSALDQRQVRLETTRVLLVTSLKVRWTALFHEWHTNRTVLSNCISVHGSNRVNFLFSTYFSDYAPKQGKAAFYNIDQSDSLIEAFDVKAEVCNNGITVMNVSSVLQSL